MVVRFGSWDFVAQRIIVPALLSIYLVNSDKKNNNKFSCFNPSPTQHTKPLFIC